MKLAIDELIVISSSHTLRFESGGLRLRQTAATDAINTRQHMNKPGKRAIKTSNQMNQIPNTSWKVAQAGDVLMPSDVIASLLHKKKT